MSARPPAIALLAAAAGGLVACGQQTPPDVMLITRTGSIPGARLSLRVTDDGHASCNRRPLVEITSAQLIQARALASDLAKAARHHVHLRPGPQSILTYTVRLEQGTLRFSDDSRGQGKPMFQLALLTRQIAQGPCHLAR